MTSRTASDNQTDARPLLTYALFCVMLFACISLVGALLDGKPALVVARSTYRGAASGVSMTLMLLGYIVGFEYAKSHLRREFQYRYPRWRSAAVQVGLLLALGTALGCFVGDALGDLLRGAWEWEWDFSKIVRGSLKTATIGALIAMAVVAYEARSLEQSVAKKDS
jgi:MFS family permease